MGEAKERAEEIEALKKQEEEKQRLLEEYAQKQKEADEKLRKLAETPLSKEEAEKRFADNKLEAMKLTVIRQKWMAQIAVHEDQINEIRKHIAELDSHMTDLQLDDALTFRRTLNVAPAMGEPVGGKGE